MAIYNQNSQIARVFHDFSKKGTELLFNNQGKCVEKLSGLAPRGKLSLAHKDNPEKRVW